MSENKRPDLVICEIPGLEDMTIMELKQLAEMMVEDHGIALAASKAREQWLAEQLAEIHNGERWMEPAICGGETDDPAHWRANAKEETTI